MNGTIQRHVALTVLVIRNVYANCIQMWISKVSIVAPGVFASSTSFKEKKVLFAHHSPGMVT